MRRWVAQMTAVEIHGTWERYVESRLVAALNHSPKHFIKEQNIAGVSGIPTGLAQYIVRGGKRFFDFRCFPNNGPMWVVANSSSNGTKLL
jgi:hypothetical protein